MTSFRTGTLPRYEARPSLLPIAVSSARDLSFMESRSFSGSDDGTRMIPAQENGGRSSPLDSSAGIGTDS